MCDNEWRAASAPGIKTGLGTAWEVEDSKEELESESESELDSEPDISLAGSPKRANPDKSAAGPSVGAAVVDVVAVMSATALRGARRLFLGMAFYVLLRYISRNFRINYHARTKDG